MLGGNLSYVDGSEVATNTTKDTSTAFTLFAEDEVNYNDLTISAGTRVEFVKTKREEALTSSLNGENKDTIVVPGSDSTICLLITLFLLVE